MQMIVRANAATPNGYFKEDVSPSHLGDAVTEVKISWGALERLGLQLEEETLEITSVDDNSGSVADYNREHPHEVIKPGDCLVEVNGIRGPKPILAELLRRRHTAFNVVIAQRLRGQHPSSLQLQRLQAQNSELRRILTEMQTCFTTREVAEQPPSESVESMTPKMEQVRAPCTATRVHRMCSTPNFATSSMKAAMTGDLSTSRRTNNQQPLGVQHQKTCSSLPGTIFTQSVSPSPSANGGSRAHLQQRTTQKSDEGSCTCVSRPRKADCTPETMHWRSPRMGSPCGIAGTVTRPTSTNSGVGEVRHRRPLMAGMVVAPTQSASPGQVVQSNVLGMSGYPVATNGYVQTAPIQESQAQIPCPVPVGSANGRCPSAPTRRAASCNPVSPGRLQFTRRIG